MVGCEDISSAHAFRRVVRPSVNLRFSPCSAPALGVGAVQSALGGVVSTKRDVVSGLGDVVFTKWDIVSRVGDVVFTKRDASPTVETPSLFIETTSPTVKATSPAAKTTSLFVFARAFRRGTRRFSLKTPVFGKKRFGLLQKPSFSRLVGVGMTLVRSAEQGFAFQPSVNNHNQPINP